MEEQMPSPSAGEIFNAFSDVQRRRVLVSLLDHNPQQVEQLSTSSRTASKMNTGPPGDILTSTSEINDADSESIRMYHSHLPKLVDYGFIEWDRDENEVLKGPKFDEIRPLLVLLEENREALPDDWL